MIRVCSLMWGSAWERYGRIFARTFDRFWPESVEMVVVADRDLPLFRGRIIPLSSVPGYSDFRYRWDGDLKASGMLPPDGAKVDQNGYAWRYDAMKWMPQALAPVTALDGMQDGDIFVWFDADTETTSPVPTGWVESLLGDADVACLQRPGTHSEIGFYAMRLSLASRSVLARFAGLYMTDQIFDLPEWHSAFAWDQAVGENGGLVIRNLNPGCKGHVWPSTPLFAHATHKKGKRKDF